MLDQFEDYFLYHPAEEGEDTFAAQFPLIVNEPNLRVHFIVSFREDAWASLDRFKGRIPELFANYVRIEHLNRVGGKDAIERPIEEYNNRLPPEAERYSVEPALVKAVLDAATAAPESANGAATPAADEIETPFLQLVMERLWHATVDAGGHALTVKTLDDVGGARRIVETHLVNALGRLAPGEQEVAAEAFRYLVTRSRRRVVQSLSDLAEWLGRPEPEVGAVLEKLTSGESGRILRPVPPPPGQTDEGARYELFHDVLGEPILEWRRDFEAERERAAEARRQRAVRRRLGAIALGLLGARRGLRRAGSRRGQGEPAGAARAVERPRQPRDPRDRPRSGLRARAGDACDRRLERAAGAERAERRAQRPGRGPVGAARPRGPGREGLLQPGRQPRRDGERRRHGAHLEPGYG